MSFGDALGMGITIRLLDSFTGPAHHIERTARGLEQTITGAQNKVQNGWKAMAAGGGMMMIGGGILATLIHLGKEASTRASQMDLFNRQLNLLARNAGEAEGAGDKLFESLKKFAVETPFKIPEVMDAAKVLSSFGFTTDQITQKLREAGDWASIFGEKIGKTSELLGRVLTGGFGRAMIYMQGRGVNRRDLAQEAKSMGVLKELFTDDKGSKVKSNYDGEKMVAVMTALLTKRFGGKMNEYMQTIPGMMSNVIDKGILGLDTIGKQINQNIIGILKAIQKTLDSKGWESFMIGVGRGLNTLMQAAKFVFAPLAIALSMLIRASEHHPAFAKWATIAFGLVGALLLLGGAIIVVHGLMKVWAISGAAQAMINFKMAVLGALGPLSLLLVASTLFYIAWKNNFGGLQTTMKVWWDNISTVFSAVGELLSSMKDGVGLLSEATYNALQKRGLAALTIGLFMAFYRAYQILSGAWQAVKDFGTGIAWLGGVVWTALYPVRLLAYGIYKVAEYLGIATAKTDANGWKGLGYTLMFVAGTFWLLSKTVAIGSALYNTFTAIQYAFTHSTLLTAAAAKIATAATWLWQGAQWAINAAMSANPIGLIILGIGLLVGLCVLLWRNWEKVRTGFNKVPDWALWLFPIIGIPLLMVRYWGKVKEFGKSIFGEFSQGFWDMWNAAKSVFSDLWDAVKKLWASMKEMGSTIWEQLKGIWNDLAAAAKKLWADVGPALVKMWEALKPILAKSGMAILKFLAIVLAVIAVVIVGTLVVAILILAKVLQFVLWCVNWVIKAFTWLIKTVGDAGKAIFGVNGWLVVLRPLAYMPEMIMLAWGLLKQFFIAWGTGLKNMWSDTMDWLTSKLWNTVALMLRMVAKITNMLPKSWQPKAFQGMNIDALDGKTVKGLFNTAYGDGKSGLSKEQMDKLLPNRNVQTPVENKLEEMVRSNTKIMDILAKQPIQTFTTVNLDGREIGRSTSLYQRELAVDGSTF